MSTAAPISLARRYSLRDADRQESFDSNNIATLMLQIAGRNRRHCNLSRTSLRSANAFVHEVLAKKPEQRFRRARKLQKRSSVDSPLAAQEENADTQIPSGSGEMGGR